MLPISLPESLSAQSECVMAFVATNSCGTIPPKNPRSLRMPRHAAVSLDKDSSGTIAELAMELAFAGVGNALDFGDALGNFLNCHALMLTAQILPQLISPSLCFRIRLFRI